MVHGTNGSGGLTAARMRGEDLRETRGSTAGVSVALKFANNNWTDPFSRIKLGPKVRVEFIYPQGNDKASNALAYQKISGRDPAELPNDSGGPHYSRRVALQTVGLFSRTQPSI